MTNRSLKARNFVSLIALLTLSTSVIAADPPAKEGLCQSCHGANGAKPLFEAYPKINGQNKAYLVNSLNAYRAGQRQGGMSAVMTGIAKGLTDAEIEELANYYSSK